MSGTVWKKDGTYIPNVNKVVDTGDGKIRVENQWGTEYVNKDQVKNIEKVSVTDSKTGK